MNKKQRRALWIGVIVIALMCLWPPWMDAERSWRDAGGYGFLFYPEPFTDGPEQIDFGRLSVQCFVVALLTTTKLVTSRSGRKGKNDEP